MESKINCKKNNQEKPTIFNFSLPEWLMNASVFLATTTSFLYVSGTTYINIYLTKWGIESSLISASTQEILFTGSKIWFQSGVFLAVQAFGLFISVIFPTIYLLSIISKSESYIKFSAWAPTKYQSFFDKKENEVDSLILLQSFAQTSYKIFILIILLSFFLSGFYVARKEASSQAEGRAEAEYQHFSSNQTFQGKLFSRKKILTINNVEQVAYILANSTSLIALYIPALHPDTEQSNPKVERRPEQVLIIPITSVSEIKAIKNNINIGAD